jgi:hypothetical protein
VGVFIALPTASGVLRWSIGRALSVLGAKSIDAACPWSFAIAHCVGRFPVSEARNELVKTFLSNTKCEWMWFWDDDQDVPDNFMDLLNYTGQSRIVSGLVWMWKADAPEHAKLLTAHGDFNPSNGTMTSRSEPNSSEPYFVDAAGTGFLLIHRSLIEAAGASPFGTNLTQLEDLGFCRTANAMGHRVLVVPSVNPNHVKHIPFNDLYAYSRAYMKFAVEKLDEHDRSQKVLT